MEIAHVQQTSNETTTARQQEQGQRFLQALAARDFNSIAPLFDGQTTFRALTPSALREGTSAAEAAGWIRK